MSLLIPLEKNSKRRRRLNPVRKWDHKEETALINFLKQHRDFEKPNARMYYLKFITESGMDISPKLASCKVRNMRTTYRRAKEYQLSKSEANNIDAVAIKNIMMNICWYVDDFDIIFPNEMNKNTFSIPQESSFDDESLNQESVSNDTDDIPINHKTPNFNEELFNEKPIVGLFSKSLKKDILAVQKGKFNYKKYKFYKETIKKQQKLNLAKKKLEFEKQKFRYEMRLKEKEFESKERLKIMELNIKERIAMKELDLKEKLNMQSIEESFNISVYH